MSGLVSTFWNPVPISCLSIAVMIPAIHQWFLGGCSFCPRIGLVFGEVRLCIVIDIYFGYVARHRQQKEC